MVRKYGSKKEKFQVAKQWAADEGRLVWEMERVMDIELILEGQTQWEEDSPHHLAMMHEMFQHAAAKGWKEAEWIVCQGRHTCHSAGGTSNLRKRTAGTIPGGLQTTLTSRVSSQGTSIIGGGGVLPQRLPRAEREEDICGHSKVPADQPPTLKKWSLPEGKRGQLGGEESGHHT